MPDNPACAACGAEMRVGRENHRYVESGLSNVTLTGIEVRRCSNGSCGEVEIAIPNIDGLHKAIAEAILRKRGRFTKEEWRCLLTYLGRAEHKQRVRAAVDRVVRRHGETLHRLTERTVRTGNEADSSAAPDNDFPKRVRIAAARIRTMTPAEIEHWSAGDNREAIVSGGSGEVPVRSHLAITSKSAALVLSRCGLTEEPPRPTPSGLRKLAKLVKKYRRKRRP